MAEYAEYTWEEVAKHNTLENLWLIYEDGVYDITAFVAKSVSL